MPPVKKTGENENEPIVEKKNYFWHNNKTSVKTMDLKPYSQKIFNKINLSWLKSDDMLNCAQNRATNFTHN